VSNFIADTAAIGKDCTLGHNVVILDNVQIGDNVYIGHNVVIHESTKVGNNVYVDDGSILGRMPRSGASSRRKVHKELAPLEIGDDSIISVNAVLYRGTKIGKQVMVGDLASVREQNEIGDRSIIGRLVMVEPRTKIGVGVIVQTGTHITGDAVIEDDVFFGDEVSTSNDNAMRRGTGIYKGPHIKRGARIGSNATLLPGVIIGEEAVVAAGALVSRDVPDRKIVMGVPAKIVRDVPQNELLPPKGGGQ